MRQTIREWLRRMLAVFLSLVMIGGGFPTTALAVSKTPLTVTGLSVEEKMYDGKQDATIKDGIVPVLDGIATADINKVSVDMSKVHAKFADPNAADGKTVYFEWDEGALTGDSAYKYQLVIPNVRGDIKPVEVFVINFDAESKGYDGKAAAVVKSDKAEIYQVSDQERVNNPELKAVATDPHFEDATVGEHNVWYGIELRVGEETTATPNYKVNETQSQMKTTASITPRVVTLEWDTTPLVYNDQEQAPTATVTNAVEGDEVTVTVTGAKKDAGEGYEAFASELAGANAGNYTLSGTENREKKFSIAQANLQNAATITGVEESYGYTGQQIKPEPTVTMSDGDHDWTLVADTDYTVEYGENINVGAGSLTVKATKGGNYTDEKTANFQIVKVDPEVTTDPEAATDLVYKAEDQDLLSQTATTSDGTVQYAFGKDDQTAPEGEDKWAAGMPQKRDAGDYYVWWKVVGDDNHNDKDPECVGKVTIAKATVTVSGVKAQNKTYNGKTDASLDGNASLNGVEEVDKKAVSLINGTAEFEDKNVGENKKVTFKDFKLEGERASNYELKEQPADDTASIYPVPVILGGITAEDKAYDGTITATLNEESLANATISGVLKDDDLTVATTSYEAEFEDANVGENKKVNFKVALDGKDKGNYKINDKNSQTSTTASITKGEASVKVTPAELTYNGKAQTLATAEVKPEGAKVLWYVGDEEPTTETKWSEDVPSATNAGDYTVWYVVPGDDYYTGTEPESQTITIAPLEAELSWKNTNPIYDGTVKKPVATVTNLVDGDTCTVSVTSGRKSAGNGTASAYKLTNANYTLPEDATCPFVVAPREVTLSWKNTNPIYDGTVKKPVATVTNLVGSDSCTVYVNAGRKSAGNGTASAYKLNNANYTLPEDATCPFVVAQRVAKLAWSPKTLTYDGTVKKPGATVSNLVGSDSCTVSVTSGRKSVGKGTARAYKLSNVNYALPEDATFQFEVVAPKK